jgi:membrane protease YdiL (CAAX protease family)
VLPLHARRPDLPPGEGLPPPPRPDVRRDIPPLFGPVPWGILDAVPLFFVNLGVAAFGATLLFRWFSLHGAALYTIASAIQSVALAGAVLFWMRYVKPAPVALFGRPARPAVDLIAGALLGVAMLVAASVAAGILIGVISAITGHTVHPPERIPTSIRGAWFWAIGPVLFVVAPIGEELFFRGFLYRALRDRLEVAPAVLISAAAFALAHVYPLAIPVIFVDGVILALIYERRRNLVANIAAHAVNNLIVFLILLGTHA